MKLYLRKRNVYRLNGDIEIVQKNHLLKQERPIKTKKKCFEHCKNCFSGLKIYIFEKRKNRKFFKYADYYRLFSGKKTAKQRI